MRISHIQIHNFRNFHHLQLDLGDNVVIVGENKIGKSNLIHALRLVLDPWLPDAERHLRLEDFWDGLPRPLTRDDVISISVDLTDFEDREGLIAILHNYLIHPTPMVSRLTYLFRPLPGLQHPPRKESDYEPLLYGGDRPDNRIKWEDRRWMPLTVLPALRNAEADLANWRESPLAPLLRAAAANIDRDDLDRVASEVSQATSQVASLADIRDLAQGIQERLTKMVGENHAVQTTLGFVPTNPDRLLRSLRLFIDGGARGISDASLGTANLIYLSLLALELERQVATGERSHTFLAIEEPEAHLHPHLQRLAFRDFMRTRMPSGESISDQRTETIILTTHSPHIVSVCPLKSIVLLRKSHDDESTIGISTATLPFDEALVRDLERYLDVNRGEIVFAKGVILAEGAAEEFIIPIMGKLLGHDFDQLGISVCSVNGTNFDPYLHLLGSDGLNIPMVVVTDFDPQGDGESGLGEERVATLMKLVLDKAKFARMAREDLLRTAPNHGIFLGDYTLEVDLFQSGQHEVMCKTIIDLTSNSAARTRADRLRQKPDNMDPEQLLKDITEIGKGRFAERLATRLESKACPSYIEKAIEYVAGRVH